VVYLKELGPIKTNRAVI